MTTNKKRLNFSTGEMEENKKVNEFIKNFLALTAKCKMILVEDRDNGYTVVPANNSVLKQISAAGFKLDGAIKVKKSTPDTEKFEELERKSFVRYKFYKPKKEDENND